MAQNPILSVKDLNVRLNGDVILQNLTFDVNNHEVLIILGPNGAGKTTLLRTLLGALPHEGSVNWNAKKISYLPPQEFFARKDLPPLSIKEFFKFKNVTDKKIEEILNSVGLELSVLKKQFTTLSTGMFQRMLIAWSLVDDPDVLIFDEPTSGIDVGGEETIYSLLHKFWKEKHLTILLVTHDLNIVWGHASKVLCLNKKKLCMGPADKVLSPENIEKLYGTNVKFYRHEHGND